MIDLNDNFTPGVLNRCNQLAQICSVFVGTDHQHFGTCLTLLKDAGMFDCEIANTSPCAFNVIVYLTFRHKTIR